MKRFHHVTISVFLKQREEPSLLDPLLPIPTKNFFAEQFVYDQNHERTKIYALPKQRAKLTLQESGGFDGDLSVLKILFSKITHTNGIFDFILEQLSDADKKLLEESALERTDTHGQFVLRLDKKALSDDTYQLTSGGDCVHVSFLLAAYPKNEKTIKKCVENLFDT